MHSKEHLGKGLGRGAGRGRASKWAPSPGFDRFGPFFAWELPQREASWVQPLPAPGQMLACTSGRSTCHPKRQGAGDGGGDPPQKQRPE